MSEDKDEKFERLESVRLLPLRILQVLERYSDINHPLKQEEIIGLLKRDYKNTCERRTVKKSVVALIDGDFQIEKIKPEKGKGDKQNTGVYYDGRQLTDAEIEIVMGLVRSSKIIPENYKKNIIKTLSSLASPTFREAFNSGETASGGSVEAFLNTEIINEAIASKKQIKFVFNKYAINKKLEKSSEQVVSPHRTDVREQKHYLVGVNEEYHQIWYYRLDHISDVEILDEVATDFKSAENYNYWLQYERGEAQRPYLYTDKPEGITLLCDKSIVDQIVDCFGKNFTVFDSNETKCKVHVVASPMAMKYWAIQYLNGVEVLTPIELRENIKQEIQNAAKRYEG